MDGAAATLNPTQPDNTEAPDRRPAEDNPSIEPRRVIEALLFASDSPLAAPRLSALLGVGDARDVRRHIASLNEEYDRLGSAFRVEEIAGGFQMLTRSDYHGWLQKLLRAREETRLSPAALETLAIIAYRQPCTRAQVEAIRGVAVGDVVNRLREMGLVKITGRAEDLGRPLLYGTTKRFLEVFGLPSIEDLPQIEALKSGAGTGRIDQSTDSSTSALQAQCDSDPPHLTLVRDPEADESRATNHPR